MIFSVLSRAGAIAYSYKNDIPKTAIISISDVYSENIQEEHPAFAQNPQIENILFLNFNDVERGEPFAITDEDGRKIADYVRNLPKTTEQILVHCGVGVSRSAGVCAAIMKYLTGDDSIIFDSGRYCPNMTCYRTVLNALYFS